MCISHENTNKNQDIDCGLQRSRTNIVIAPDSVKIQNVMKITQKTALYHISPCSDHSCMPITIISNRKDKYAYNLLDKNYKSNERDNPQV
jgi:hypothetical protein